MRFGKLELSLQNPVTVNGLPIVQVQVAGREKNTYTGIKMVNSSESAALRYVSHCQQGNTLCIRQETDCIRAETFLTAYSGTNTLRFSTRVTNLTEQPLVLEEVCAAVLPLDIPLEETAGAEVTLFPQSHHGECQSRTLTLNQLGLSALRSVGQYRVCGGNVGSWSTKELLPQGIFAYKGQYTMFQIESNHSWYYEISDFDRKCYLYMGGANAAFGSWCKRLPPGESYHSPCCAVSWGESLDDVIGKMTIYRRQIAARCAADERLPAIFNEYMHISWDSPDEQRVRQIAPKVAAAGAEYYVIDCGWHDEVPGDQIYPYVGVWKESHTRFPSGLRKTTDYLRSLGMKPGLWIEPEIIGKFCEEMLAYYDEDCFLRRHGQKICCMGRYFLDFRHPKVVQYLSETVRRMVEDYGAEYIKMDYNQDMGVGCDADADSPGEGLEQCAAAYLAWVDSVRQRFPEVLFETCSSGGLRMDQKTMQHFTVVSTSDQTDYQKYPHIAGNLLSAVLPEQGAVWSYPVDRPAEQITREQVIMNMVNSLLGRIHLASDLRQLSEADYRLVQEGVAYYKAIAPQKKTALPCFPLGFADANSSHIASGLVSGGKCYLAVWNLGGEKEVAVPVAYTQAVCAYPKQAPIPFTLENGVLHIQFTEGYQARFFELK